MNKKDIIKIIKKNPNMSYSKLRSQAEDSGVPISLFNEAWQDSLGEEKKVKKSNIKTNKIQIGNKRRKYSNVIKMEFQKTPEKYKSRAIMLFIFIASAPLIIIAIIGLSILAGDFYIVLWGYKVILLALICYLYALFILRKKEQVNEYVDIRSGLGDSSVVPEEVKKWSWGAMILPFFWGPYFNVMSSFLLLIPIFNWGWWIVLGINGNEWAWKNGKWGSVEEFNYEQRKWNKYSVILIISIIFLSLSINLFSSITMRDRDNQVKQFREMSIESREELASKLFEQGRRKAELTKMEEENKIKTYKK